MSTSDLTVDETLLLHSIGWEARELVCGAAAYSIPKGFWSIGKGESFPATLAYERSVRHAADAAAQECRRFRGRGMAGVKADVEVTKHYVEATIVGTAIAPSGGGKSTAVFVSDLSVRDFVLLHRVGWQIAGLVFGGSFVFVRRRSPARLVAQAGRNVELANFTDALYTARSAAMERMQAQALRIRATGVVGVRLDEGPLPFARHAMRFAVLGTAIRPNPGSARRIGPVLALSLNDPPAAEPKVI